MRPLSQVLRSGGVQPNRMGCLDAKDGEKVQTQARPVCFAVALSGNLPRNRKGARQIGRATSSTRVDLAWAFNSGCPRTCLARPPPVAQAFQPAGSRNFRVPRYCRLLELGTGKSPEP